MTAPIFWDRLAERYAARPVSDPKAYNRWLARARAHLDPGDRVLELGCGTGTTALKLASAVTGYLATDYSPAMLEIAARKRQETPATGLEFARASVAEALAEEPDGVAAAGFDVILAFNLLHLLPDIPETLEAVSARLSPGGRFISKTVCARDRSPVLRLVIPVMRALGKAPYINFLSTRELGAMIEAAGLEVIEADNYPAHAPGRFIVARKP